MHWQAASPAPVAPPPHAQLQRSFAGPLQLATAACSYAARSPVWSSGHLLLLLLLLLAAVPGASPNRQTLEAPCCALQHRNRHISSHNSRGMHHEGYLHCVLPECTSAAASVCLKLCAHIWRGQPPATLLQLKTAPWRAAETSARLMPPPLREHQNDGVSHLRQPQQRSGKAPATQF